MVGRHYSTGRKLALAPPLPGIDALLATNASTGRVAVCTCGRVVRITRHGHTEQLWLLPSRALLLAWPFDAAALLLVTVDGRTWLLRCESGISLPHKRGRDGLLRVRQRAKYVCGEDRLSLPSLGAVAAACLAIEGLLVWRATGTAYVPLPSSVIGEGEPHSPAVARPWPAHGPWLGLDPPAQLPHVLFVHSGKCPALDGLRAWCFGATLLHTTLFGALGARYPDAALVAQGKGGALICAYFFTPAPSGNPPTMGCLGEPVAALFASAPSQHSRATSVRSVGNPLCATSTHSVAPMPADALVLLGRTGSLLLITAGRAVLLDRQLWRMHTPGVVLGGCAVGRVLIVTCTRGAFIHCLPDAHNLLDAQSAPRVGTATCAAVPSSLDLPARGRPCSVARGADTSVYALAVSSPPVTVVGLAFSPAASLSPRVAAHTIGVDGTFSSIVCLDSGTRSLAPLASSDDLNTGPSFIDAQALDSSECFIAPHTRHCLRGRLVRIGEGCSRLSLQHASWTRAEDDLRQAVLAYNGTRDMLSGLATFRAHMDGRGDLHIEVLHDSPDQDLSPRWSLAVAIIHRPRLDEFGAGCSGGSGCVSWGIGNGGGGTSVSTSRCTPLGGLQGDGRGRFDMPLPPGVWARPPSVRILRCYLPPELPTASASCARITCVSTHLYLRQVPLFRTLRSPSAADLPVLPPQLTSVRALGRSLRACLLRGGTTDDTTDVTTDSRTDGIIGDGRTGPPGGTSAMIGMNPTQCKIRLLLLSAGRSSRACIRQLLCCVVSGYDHAQNGDTPCTVEPCTVEERGSAGLGGELRRQNIVLPNRVLAVIRFGGEARSLVSGALSVSADTAPPLGAQQLLMQCETGALWTLRASLLRTVFLSQCHSDHLTNERRASLESLLSANESAHLVVASLREEAMALLPQLRRWQFAQLCLRKHILRCCAFRRALQTSGCVSLHGLSIDAVARCCLLIEMHGAVRALPSMVVIMPLGSL